VLKEFQPHSQRQNETEREIGQAAGAPFKGGVYNDLAGSSIPNTAVKDSSGYIPFEDRMQTAGGCKAWSETTIPPLSGRTGYSWSKSGTTVTKTAGTDFSEEDVGNYIVHDDGNHELISAFISITQVTVESGTAHAASTAGYLHAQNNGDTDKEINGKYLIQFGTKLYYFDAAVTAYNEIYCISYLGLLNSHSVIDVEGETAIIFNANGIFRVDLTADSGPYFYWKANTPVPRTLLTGVAATITKKYGCKYTYAMSRIAGDDIARDRTSEIVEHETGNCYPSTTDYKDYAEVWDDRPPGPGDTTYGILTGYELTGDYDTASDWSALGANCQFTISINGVSNNFSVDMTGVITMGEVASRIQQALRTQNSQITCEFVTDHFVITNPEENGTISYTSAGAEGTDIGSAAMGCDYLNGSITNAEYTTRKIISTLHCPVDPTDSAKVQQHHTHYRVDRSLDIGENGIDPISGEGNNEEQFIWHSDVPIAKSFVASRTGYWVTATEGTFQPMDEGSKLRFQDGTEITLDVYDSATQMTSTDSGDISSQAAAIGGDNSLSKPIRVMTAAQVDQTVTRSAGAIFAASDVGKTIFWPSGIRSNIIAYVDENTVTAAESVAVVSTGACMDPKCRNFCDKIRDDTLRSRISNFSLLHRFWQEIPDCDTGKLVSGWLFAAVRSTKLAYYSQVTQQKEHLIGYYYAARQYLKYKDLILGFSDFRDSMTVYCSKSTTVHPTNTAIIHKINNVTSINLISGQTVADEQRGVWDCGSYKKLPDGVDIVITSEPRLRFFDGKSFGADIADKRYTKTIEKFERAVGLLYEGTQGLTIYGREA
jgi:hypothetical protein